MQCCQCGKALPDDAHFCIYCGVRQPPRAEKTEPPPAETEAGGPPPEKTACRVGTGTAELSPAESAPDAAAAPSSREQPPAEPPAFTAPPPPAEERLKAEETVPPPAAAAPAEPPAFTAPPPPAEERPKAEEAPPASKPGGGAGAVLWRLAVIAAELGVIAFLSVRLFF